MSSGGQAGVFIVSIIFNLYLFVIMLRILLQWFRADYHNPLSQMVIKLTDVPVKPFKKLLGKFRGFDYPALLLLVIVEALKILLLIGIASAGFSAVGFIIIVIFDLIRQFLNLYFYMIIIVVLASWFAGGNYNPVLAILHKLTEPVLALARRIIPPIAGFDFSPILVIIVIKLIDIFLISPFLGM